MQNNTQESWEEIRIDCVEDLIEAGFVEQTANEAFVALKPIISSLLSKQAEEISKAVEEMEKRDDVNKGGGQYGHPETDMQIGYNQALSDTLLAIKQVTK